jgi:hypothetical protein
MLSSLGTTWQFSHSTILESRCGDPVTHIPSPKNQEKYLHLTNWLNRKEKGGLHKALS